MTWTDIRHHIARILRVHIEQVDAMPVMRVDREQSARCGSGTHVYTSISQARLWTDDGGFVAIAEGTTVAEMLEHVREWYLAFNEGHR